MNTEAQENKPETHAQYVQRLAADINTFSQLALFCGMATVTEQVPAVQLTLSNPQRTSLILSAAKFLPLLSAIGKELKDSLDARDIDTDDLLVDVSSVIQQLTKQTGG